MNDIAHRRPDSPYIKSVRPMTRDDLQFLREKSARPIISKLRDSHHNMARMFASGMPPAQIAKECGYALNRVYTLRQSPAMEELVAKYRDLDTQAWAKERDAYHEGIIATGRKAWRQIEDQLDQADEDNEPIPIQKLLAIADSSADRVGYHKKSTKENINVDFAAKLEAAITRSKPKVIEHEG